MSTISYNQHLVEKLRERAAIENAMTDTDRWHDEIHAAIAEAFLDLANRLEGPKDAGASTGSGRGPSA